MRQFAAVVGIYVWLAMIWPARLIVAGTLLLILVESGGLYRGRHAPTDLRPTRLPARGRHRGCPAHHRVLAPLGAVADDHWSICRYRPEPGGAVTAEADA